MTTWNYRVVHRTHRSPHSKLEDGYDHSEESYAIHEVYYGVDGKVIAVSMEPVPAYAESLQGLDWVLRKFREAYEKDVLEWDNIPDKSAKHFDVNVDEPEEPFGITLDGE